MNLSKLAGRYGMKPSEADASIDLRTINGVIYFAVSFEGATLETQSSFDRMCTALGVDEDGYMKAEEIGELEDRVDHALSLAPRVRSR